MARPYDPAVRGSEASLGTSDRAAVAMTPYPGAVADFADDPTTELERKARALAITALAESVTYVILFTFWLIVPNAAGKAITGAVHGMVWLTFCSMVIMITPDMKWTWKYAVAVIVLGPIGGLMVWHRIRRDGVPAPAPPAPRTHGPATTPSAQPTP